MASDYERCLVAGCKRRPELIDELRIQLADFSDPEAATVFQAIDSIRLSGRKVDDVSMWQTLGGKVPVAYVATLPEAAVHNAPWYLEKIREEGLRRRIKAAVGRLAEEVDRSDVAAADILETIEREVTGLGDNKASGIVWLKDILRPAVEDIQRRTQNRDLACTGVPTGYHALDMLTDGFQPGDLIIIAARPSLGKTALIVSLLVNMAVRGSTVCGFFSCEMSDVLIGQRFLANAGRFNLSDVRHGLLCSSDASRILSAAQDLYKEQVLLNTTPNIKLADLKGMARTMVRRGAKLIAVDYLTLIQHGDTRTPRHERVGEVSKSLKGLARELSVPVIVLSQLARTAEGSRPNLAELRQSGEIEEDSDVVMLIHREREEGPAVHTELIVAKNRNGPCGNVDMVFHPAYCRFDMEEKR